MRRVDAQVALHPVVVLHPHLVFHSVVVSVPFLAQLALFFFQVQLQAYDVVPTTRSIVDCSKSQVFPNFEDFFCLAIVLNGPHVKPICKQKHFTIFLLKALVRNYLLLMTLFLFAWGGPNQKPSLANFLHPEEKASFVSQNVRYNMVLSGSGYLVTGYM